MTEDEIREKFEAWYKSEYSQRALHIYGDRKEYVDMGANACWLGWKAAMSGSLSIEPEVRLHTMQTIETNRQRLKVPGGWLYISFIGETFVKDPP